MAQSTSRRTLRVGKWTLFVLGSALALSPLALGVLAWRAETRLQRTLGELARQGEPMRLSQLRGPALADRDNAAPVYSQASAATQLSGEDREFVADLIAGKLAVGDAEIGARAANIAQRNSKALALIHRASAMPRCQFPMDWERGTDATFPHLSGLRESARLVALESITLARAGRADDALEACGVIFQMDEAADGPSLIQQLVRYAIVGMGSRAVRIVVSQSRPSATACRRLAARLGREDLLSSLIRALKGERVVAISCFERVKSARDPLKAMEELQGERVPESEERAHREESPGTRRHRYVTRWLLASDELDYLEAISQGIRRADRPYRELTTILPALDRPESPPFTPHVMTAIFLPSFEAAFSARDKAIATLRVCQVALLLKAYKSERGLYPESLAELESLTGQELPADPFSGKPLVYRRRGEGFLLYSWGVNLRDDGGTPPPPESRDEGDIVLDCSQ